MAPRLRLRPTYQATSINFRLLICRMTTGEIPKEGSGGQLWCASFRSRQAAHHKGSASSRHIR
eukprot:4379979-Amphidinium_carterae.1